MSDTPPPPLRLDAIDPEPCPTCGQKRAFLGSPCRACIDARREEAEASRHRDREPWPPRA